MTPLLVIPTILAVIYLPWAYLMLRYPLDGR